MDVRLQHPYTCLVAGPTGCGKMQFIKKIIEQGECITNGSAEKIFWLYGEYQPAYIELSQKFSNISLIEGIPENLNEYSDSNLSVILLLQNLFYNGKEIWNISLNTHYIVLFKNP